MMRSPSPQTLLPPPPPPSHRLIVGGRGLYSAPDCTRGLAGQSHLRPCPLPACSSFCQSQWEVNQSRQQSHSPLAAKEPVPQDLGQAVKKNR